MMSFTFWRNRLAALALSLVLAAAPKASAQDVRVETQQQARERTQNALNDQEPQGGVADPELGDINLVSRQPRPKMFTFAASETFNYTSNAFLLRDDTESDYFWNSRVGVSFVPYATRDFTPRLTFTQDWFNYNRFSELEFNSQTLQLDLKYDLNHDDTWYVNGSYALARLVSPDDATGEFYRDGFLNLSITHLTRLGTTPINLGISAGGYWRHGDPSFSDRAAAYLSVAAVYNIRDNIQLSGFTRPEFQHYTHDLSGSSRQDINVLVGASLSWTANQYVAVAATATYIRNFSTIGQNKYDVVTPSLILAAQIAF